MAAIGQQLTSPESGWARFDDANTNISYSAGKGQETSSYSWGGSEAIVGNNLGDYAKFNFQGTRIRIMCTAISDWDSNKIRVNIDGVDLGTYTTRIAPYLGAQVLVYEKTGMTDTVHAITLTNEGDSTDPATGRDYMRLDSIDIDEGKALMPYNLSHAGTKMFYKLTSPDSGWIRFDDTDTNISYSAGKGQEAGASYFGGSEGIVGEAIGSFAKFNFTGTRLRVLGNAITDYRSSAVRVKIDGVDLGIYNQRWASVGTQAVLFEKTGLIAGEHYVELTNEGNATSPGVDRDYMSIDAVDIDSGCILKPYSTGAPTYVHKYLIVDGTDVKRWNSTTSTYETIGTTPLTEDMFRDYGNDTYTNNTVGLVSTTPTIHYWTDDPNILTKSTLETYRPKPLLLLTNVDKNISGVTSFIVDSTISGASTIKFILSIDSGVTWKAFNGSSWVTVDITSINDVDARAMSIATLQGLTQTQLDNLIGTATKLRIGIYYKQMLSTDSVYLNSLRINYKTGVVQA